VGIGSNEPLRALREGRAFARLPDARIVRVHGPGAIGWLQDLLTADLAGLPPGGACRTLLLGPTGRIRADLWALRRHDEVVLVQDPAAGRPIEVLLAPYVLSSRVTLAPEALELVAGAGDVDRHDAFVPSLLGTRADALVPTTSVEQVVDAARNEGLVEIGPDDLERWRIRRGIPRMGVDFEEGSLPSEARLDDAIAHDKGCYLGQESVARVRNLGHPATVLLHLRSDGVLRAGDDVSASGTPAGTVTSGSAVAPAVALARVGWASRDAILTGPDGHRLEAVASSA
jgi:folate-binding protein YgfZ